MSDELLCRVVTPAMARMTRGCRLWLWGIKVNVVEVKDVEIPTGMQRAMARQAEAERERRAKVISAEGEYQASTKLGEAAAVISQNPVALQLATCRRCSRSRGTNNSTTILPVPIDLMLRPL